MNHDIKSSLNIPKITYMCPHQPNNHSQSTQKNFFQHPHRPTQPYRTLHFFHPISLPPLSLQHPQTDHIMILAIIPQRLPLPPLVHKSQSLIQLPRTLIIPKSTDLHAMHIRMAESPLQRPEHSLRPVALALIWWCQGDSDHGVAMVQHVGVDGHQRDGADWSWGWFFGRAVVWCYFCGGGGFGFGFIF